MDISNDLSDRYIKQQVISTNMAARHQSQKMSQVTNAITPYSHVTPFILLQSQPWSPVAIAVQTPEISNSTDVTLG